MATHESLTDHFQPEPGSDRAFGFIVGGILLAVAMYFWWIDSYLYPSIAVVAITLITLALIYPRSLGPLNRIWTRFGLLLGRVVSPVVLGVIYLTTVVPTGLLVRLFGKDLLSLKIDKNLPSYWIERDPRGPAPDSLKDQF